VDLHQSTHADEWHKRTARTTQAAEWTFFTHSDIPVSDRFTSENLSTFSEYKLPGSTNDFPIHKRLSHHTFLIASQKRNSVIVTLQQGVPGDAVPWPGAAWVSPRLIFPSFPARHRRVQERGCRGTQSHGRGRGGVPRLIFPSFSARRRRIRRGT